MSDFKNSKWSRKKGLTILEMIISIAIFALVSAAFASIFNQSIFSYGKISNESDAAQKAQMVMSWISRDLSSATCIQQINSDAIVLRNSSWSHVRYYLDPDDESILLRSDLTTDHVISEDVANFDLKYYDSANNVASDSSQVAMIEINFTASSKDQQFSLNTVVSPEKTNECWQYRRKITIDGGEVKGNLANFPVLVNTKNFSSGLKNTLKDTSETGGHVAQLDGGDISFTASDGTTKLAHEIEQYTSTAGELMAWVNVENLYEDVDAVIYIYYGNPDPFFPDQWNTAAVWDANYKGVWHLNEGVADEGSINNVHIDSTSNSNDGDQEGNEGVTGQIANSQHFEDGDDYINAGGNASINITGNLITVSAWINADSWTSSEFDGTIVDKTEWAGGVENGYALTVGDGGRVAFRLGTGTQWETVTTGDEMSTGQWYYIAGIYDGSDMEVFINGDDEEDNGFSGNISSGSTNLNFGRNADLNDRFFDGRIDEIRISDIARSKDWIETSDKNQRNPEQFMVFGPEEEMW